MTDLKLIEEDFYNNKDKYVSEVWQDYKFKWLFPRYRKRKIEKALFMSYLMHKTMIKKNV